MNIIIIDDSALYRFFIREIFSKDDNFKIVAEASNGVLGLEAVKKHDPDFIILDIQMPIMDGITTTKKIMEYKNYPILIFSTLIDADTSFRAYQAGALDVMNKPDINQFNDPIFMKSFFDKIYFLVDKKIRNDITNIHVTKEVIIKPKEHIVSTIKPVEVIVIGASTGGPVAIREILYNLPTTFSIPIIIVQHLEKGFDEGFSKWLEHSTKLDVILVKEVVKLTPSTIYIAPANKHLIFKDRFSLITNDSEKVLNQKPSINLLFDSAASIFKDKTLGILLTGMGRDGASGCKTIVECGGQTIVQDKDSSVIFGMPKEAIELEAATIISPLNRISTIIGEL